MLAEPGSQLTAVLNLNRIQASKNSEAQMYTQGEKNIRGKKRYFYAIKKSKIVEFVFE